MSILTRRSKATRAAGALAVVALAAGTSLVGGSPAGADPKQFSALSGVGSDTTQDIMNALAGFSSGTNYTPIQSSVASGQRQEISFDATGSTCITPKPTGVSMNRPNGSSAGRRALSRAIDGQPYGDTAGPCGAKSVSGLIDFARSSAGPTAGDTGTALTYVPFGRDGVSFGYYANGVASPVTSLTQQQLNSLFTTGPQTINGVSVIPCGIQTSSGTFAFFNTVTGANPSQESTATTTCNNAGNGQRLQENDGNGLKAKGDAQVGSEVVVGFSAANFISQSNGVVTSQLPAGVGLGAISDNGSGTSLGLPYSGTAPNLTPNPTFYNDAKFGRNVYNVVDTALVTGFGNVDLKTILGITASPNSICASGAQTIVNRFGFLSVATCGSVALKGSLLTGTF